MSYASGTSDGLGAVGPVLPPRVSGTTWYRGQASNSPHRFYITVHTREFADAQVN